MSVHQHKDGRWYCTYYEGKGKKFEYFGRGDLAEAQARRRDEEIKRNRGKWQAYQGGITVKEICQKHHEQHPVRESTLHSDFYRLDRHIVPQLGGRSAEILSTQDLNEYVQKRLQSGVKRRTIAREIDILRAAFNWAEAQNPPLILRNSLAKYRVPKEKGSDEVPAPPTIEEFRRILKHAPEHLRRCLLIQWYCGVRPGGEASRMMWADVDFTNAEIRVVGARKGGPAIRYVPIHEELKSLLLQWKEADERLLEMRTEKSRVKPENGRDIQSFPVVHYYLKPIASLKTAWGSAKANAGISRRLRLYDFRHAWFTNALRAGADLKATSETGGHSGPTPP